jgi:hypothetical protein
MGSAIFVSNAILQIRKRAFEKQLEELAERKKKHSKLIRTPTNFIGRRRNSNSSDLERADASGVVVRDPPRDWSNVKDRRNLGHGNGEIIERNGDMAGDQPSSEPIHNETIEARLIVSDSSIADRGDSGRPGITIEIPRDRVRHEDRRVNTARSLTSPGPLKRHHTRLFDGSGVGARGTAQHPRNARPMSEMMDGSNSIVLNKSEEVHKLSSITAFWKEFTRGRNSQFHNLSESQRLTLGGVEYDAIVVLSYIVPTYFVLWQLLGALGVGAWLQVNRPGLALSNG